MFSWRSSWGLLTLAAVCVGVLQAASSAQAFSQQCSDSQYPAARSMTNPLDLNPAPAGSNPLAGATFFVDGPAHGMAAGAIAQALGLTASDYPDGVSFAQFWASLAADPSSASQLGATNIKALGKIASQPEPQRLSLYSGGGGPGAIYDQTQKILCKNLTADPGTIPILETFFIYPDGQYCPLLDALNGNTATFDRQVSEFAMGIGRHPAVVLVELDSIGSAACMNVPKGTGHEVFYWTHHRIRGRKVAKLVKRFVAYPPSGSELDTWSKDLAYEINQLELHAPNTVIYTEGGYADGNGYVWTAQMLNMVVSALKADGGSTAGLRGFFTNDTHNDWAATEVEWASNVSKQLSSLSSGYVAHFVVNTAESGKGPDLPSSKVSGGNEILCNAPGRGLGPIDNTNPANLLSQNPGNISPGATDWLGPDAASNLDAFLWVHTPGRSSGSCNGGPAPGDFWPARAVELAQNANQQLGGEWPSLPY